jgi:hypothetical protein
MRAASWTWSLSLGRVAPPDRLAIVTSRSLRACVVCAALLAALVCTDASSAAGSRQDQLAAQQLVRAWRDYFAGALATLPDAHGALGAFAGAVTGACPGVLAQVDAQPPSARNGDAISMFLSEIEADLDLVGVKVTAGGVSQLSAAAERLRWRGEGLEAQARGLVAGWENYISQPVSDLCADAQALADSGGATLSGRSYAFVVRAGSLSIDFALDDALGRTARDCVYETGALACLAGRAGRADAAAMRTNFSRYMAERRKFLDQEKQIAIGFGLTNVWASYEFREADSSAKSDARNMVSQIESCYTDTQDYRGCNSEKELGPTGLPWGSGPGEVKVVRAGRNSYRISAHSRSGTRFVITKNRKGVLTRSCSRRGTGGCGTDGHW